MKKIKKMPLILSLIVLVLSFSACSKTVSNKPKEQTKNENMEKTKNGDTKETKNAGKSTSGTISDDLYKYQVSINGVVYSFPTSFSTFQKNGWVGEDFGNVKLEPNQYTLKNIRNGQQSMMVKIANFGINVSPLSECHIGGIRIESDTKKQGAIISIAKGITIDSTYDEVIAAYGKPSDEYKGTSLTKLTYKSGIYSNYKISIDIKTKKVSCIEIENLVKPAKTQTTSVNTELPAIVKNYKAPSSIGNDLFSFQVKYGGNLYKLPAPIAELEKNGWVLQSNANEVIAAKSSAVGIELRKDNQILKTQIQNYSDKAEPLKHCFVTYMEYYNNGAQIHLELPKGISEKSSIDQVIAAYGQPTKVDEGSSFKHYEYGKIFTKVTFVTNKGKIEKIEVSHFPKKLD